jgi:hypothetical protein
VVETWSHAFETIVVQGGAVEGNLIMKEGGGERITKRKKKKTIKGKNQKPGNMEKVEVVDAEGVSS